jgi:hypothetical protein
MSTIDSRPTSARRDDLMDATARHTHAVLRQAVDEPRDKYAAERRCAECGRPFDLAIGEVWFTEKTGAALPTKCRRCRPSRRESIALGIPR